jgi:hypothetical protein
MRLCKFLPFANLTLLLAAIFFLPSSQLHAGASNKNGSPYGNGSFFNGGTFSAVIRGQNLSGTMLVSAPPGGSVGSNSTSTNGGGGVATIIFEGQNYNANANANVDASSGQIAGNFYGGMELSGNGSNSVLLSTTNSPTPIVGQSNVISAITTPYFSTNFSSVVVSIPQTNVTVSYNTVPTNIISTNVELVPLIYTNTNTTVSYITNFGVSQVYTTNFNYTFTYNTNITQTNYYSTNYSTNYITNPVVVNGVTNGYVTNANVSITQVITNTTTTYNLTVITNSNPQVSVYTYTNPSLSPQPQTNYYLTAQVTYYTNFSYSTNITTTFVPLYVTNVSSVLTSQPVTNVTVSGYNTNGYTNTVITFTNYLNLQQDATTEYNNAMQIVGYYQGPLNNSYPNQTFSGNGQITSTQLAFGTNGLPSMQTQSSSIVVQGILISSSMETFSTYSNAVPYATTVYGVTNLTTNSF